MRPFHLAVVLPLRYGLRAVDQSLRLNSRSFRRPVLGFSRFDISYIIAGTLIYAKRRHQTTQSR